MVVSSFLKSDRFVQMSKKKRVKNERSQVSSVPPTFHASGDEVAQAILLGVFRRVAPVFGQYVIDQLKNTYGPDKWLAEALSCLSRNMGRYLTEDGEALRRDVFIIVQVLLSKADEVFMAKCTDLGDSDCQSKALFLHRLVLDMDCVGQARNLVFHGYVLSRREAHRCLVSLQRLWKHFFVDSQTCSSQEEEFIRQEKKVSITR